MSSLNKNVVLDEIGSEFWDVPLSPEENHLFPNSFWCGSGRAALSAILKDIKTKKHDKKELLAALPSYLCESMIDPFLKEGIRIRFYPVSAKDGHLVCDYKIVDGCDIVLLLDYFGYANSVERPSFSGQIVIRDLTHSIFCGCPDDADYCFGSLRKWAGFIGGGFVFGRNGFAPRFEGIDPLYVSLRKEAVEKKVRYLNKETESKDYLEIFEKAEERLRAFPAEGCPQEDIDSARFLDVAWLCEKRRENARALIAGLKGLTLFESVSEHSCPLCVPILVKCRDELRAFLIRQKIYCPVHWPRPSLLPDSVSAELYNQELSLPCDQRYGVEDMIRIIDAVKSFLKGEEYVESFDNKRGE